MLKPRFVVSAFVAAIGIAVSAPPAHAGGASGQALPAGTTACRVVLNSANVPYVLNLTGFGSASQNVQVASLALLCDMAPGDGQVGGTVVKGPTLTTVDSPTADLMTCYLVSGANQDKQPATITDMFGVQSVMVSGYELFCVPAQVEPVE